MRPFLIGYSAAIAISSTFLTLLLSGLAHQVCAFWRYQNPGTDLPELTLSAPWLAKLATAIPLVLLAITIAMIFPKNFREKWLVHGMAITCLMVILTAIVVIVAAGMPAMTTFHHAENPPGLD